MKKPLKDETPEETELANELVDGMLVPYRQKKRDRFEGPITIGDSLSLREDYYAATFLFWFKRQVIFADGIDEEEGPEEKEEPKKIDEE